MTLKRREILIGATAIATGSLTAQGANQGKRVSSRSTATLPQRNVGTRRVEPLMHMAQARKIMEIEGIDAMVLGEGINFYHASGHRPVTSKMGHRPSSFAIVTRSKEQPLSLVMASFTYYYQLADSLDVSEMPIYLFTGAQRDEPDQALPVSTFPDRGAWPMDNIESRRASLTGLADREIGAAPGIANALTRALTDAGVSQGTIALDIQGVEGLLQEALPKARFTSAGSALSRIRPIKSPTEIAFMRQAATVNAEAALAAVATVRSGASYRDLRAEFSIEAAKRGNRSVFMVIDRVSAEHYDAPFEDGQSFLIDAVSEYQGYHGDYGRTVFVGEPRQSMTKATHAMGRAWDELRHELKPGMRFSEVSALGKQILKKLGGSYAVSFTPHSVGLYHTDHVDQSGIGFAWQDRILEPGMIISVDCPLLEAGIGGSAHLEDLMLITENGSEAINAVGDQVIIV